MRGEILINLNLQISHEIAISPGHRIVSVHPVQPRWENIELANHNVLRLNALNEVVWLVRRVENPTRMPWDQLHASAKEKHAQGDSDESCTSMGHLDPFTHLGLDERHTIETGPGDVWRPGCVVYLLTRWWRYVLDPVGGVATCTGRSGEMPRSPVPPSSSPSPDGAPRSTPRFSFPWPSSFSSNSV